MYEKIEKINKIFDREWVLWYNKIIEYLIYINMSFTEKVLAPDDLTQGESRYEEINGKKKWGKEVPADGEKVGPIQQIADNSDDNEQEKPQDWWGKNTPKYDFEWINNKIARNSINELKAKEDDHPTPEEILAQFQGSALWEARTAEWTKKDNIA